MIILNYRFKKQKLDEISLKDDGFDVLVTKWSLDRRNLDNWHVGFVVLSHWISFFGLLSYRRAWKSPRTFLKGYISSFRWNCLRTFSTPGLCGLSFKIKMDLKKKKGCMDEKKCVKNIYFFFKAKIYLFWSVCFDLVRQRN